MFDKNDDWTPIPDYEGFYEISSDGAVRSFHRKKTRLMTARIDRGGYYAVALSKRGETKTKRVHRLVAETFIPNTENKPLVNHKDSNKLNNNIANLEWVTHSENLLHAYGQKLIRRRKIKVMDFCSGKLFSSVMEAAKAFGIAYSSLKNSLAGRRPNKTCLGYAE